MKPEPGTTKTELRKHVRLLIQLADDWADTEVDDERTYALPSGGMHIRAQDVYALCEACSAMPCARRAQPS
jgi:hypothetical protein